MAKVSSFNNAGYVTSYSTIPHHMIKTFAYDDADHHHDDIDGLFWSNSRM